MDKDTEKSKNMIENPTHDDCIKLIYILTEDSNDAALKWLHGHNEDLGKTPLLLITEDGPKALYDYLYHKLYGSAE